MAGKLHRYGFIEVDGVRYHVTRCMDHKHCSSTERKTGYKVQEVLEGYARFKQIYSSEHQPETQQTRLF